LFISKLSFAQITAHQQALIDSLVTDYGNVRQFSGVVLAGKNGNILYQQAVGYADREMQIKNAASMGKTFTAVMIMQLVQEGKLRLDQTIKKLLPGTRVMKADSITVFHLLTHTSGIGNYMMHSKFEEDRNRLKSLTGVVPYVEDMEPTMSTVCSSFEYSNSGFIVLGRIIETVTGKEYQQNLQERIFTPSGITNSYLHYPATFQAPSEAVPYIAYTAKTYTNAIKEEFPAFSDMLENLGQINNAFAMHEIGRREFPADASMYSITGQLYQSQKQLEEARKWYMKALEINPNDEFAKMRLANLKVK
jgi:CubicO group peptidase (beta-lactamase class C family)